MLKLHLVCYYTQIMNTRWSNVHNSEEHGELQNPENWKILIDRLVSSSLTTWDELSNTCFHCRLVDSLNWHRLKKHETLQRLQDSVKEHSNRWKKYFNISKRKSRIITGRISVLEIEVDYPILFLQFTNPIRQSAVGRADDFSKI